MSQPTHAPLSAADRAELDGQIGSPIRNLYFFDDLSANVRRVAAASGVMPETLTRVMTAVRSTIFGAIDCTDHGQQDVRLLEWDHACAELSFQLWRHQQDFDVLVSQGSNGQHALTDLNNRHAQQYGHTVSAAVPNIRVTHFYEDPTDPFYSPITLGVSRGKPLDEQCAEAAGVVDSIYRGTRRRIRLGIFDECIATGKSTETVATKVAEQLAPDVRYSIEVVALVASEATIYRLAEKGWPAWVGIVVPGGFMPEAWNVDLHLLKDQVLTTALRYPDGSSEPPFRAPGWYERVFVADSPRAARLFEDLHDLLDREGLLSALSDL